MNKIPRTLEGEALRRRLQSSYKAYTAFVNEGYVLTKAHSFLLDRIENAIYAPVNPGQKFKVMVIKQAPRTGKSLSLTETLPSWYLGKFPTREVIISAYNTSFAEQFSIKNRTKFENYGKDIFNLSLSESMRTASRWATSRGGVCHSAGIMADLTGYGGHLVILDDLIKNREEAESRTIIPKIIGELYDSVHSRVYPGGLLIAIGTPWVQGDVLESIEFNWADLLIDKITLPALWDEWWDKRAVCPLGRKVGDALIGPHLDKNITLPLELSWTNETVASTRDMLLKDYQGIRTWNSLHQCRPSIAEGSLFKTENVKLFSLEDESYKDLFEKADFVQVSIDASFGKKGFINDFVAIVCQIIKDGKIYLTHVINKKLSFSETLHVLKTFCKEIPGSIDEVIIEEAANGYAILDVLHQDADFDYPLVAVKPLGGKESRAQAAAEFINMTGRFFVNKDIKEENIDWHLVSDLKGYKLVLEQLDTFPYGAHDDMVDAIGQSITRLRKMLIGEIKMERREFYKYVDWFPDMWADYERLNETQAREFIKIYGAPKEWMNV